MKTAIVMGATSGIGLEVARQLAASGWHVGIAGRRTERLIALVDTTRGIDAYAAIDVTHADAPSQLLALASRLGGMHLYVHCSGIGWQNAALDADKELATVSTNGMGFTRMMTAVFGYMAQHNGGHIACISSIAGTKGLGAAPSYSATKAFQQHYLESLTQLATMRRLPITVTDIRPGFVATDLIAGSHFPMQLDAERVARRIVTAIRRRQAVMTIDWRYRIVVALWRCVPRWLWTRMRIG